MYIERYLLSCLFIVTLLIIVGHYHKEVSFSFRRVDDFTRGTCSCRWSKWWCFHNNIRVSNNQNYETMSVLLHMLKFFFQSNIKFFLLPHHHPFLHCAYCYYFIINKNNDSNNWTTNTLILLLGMQTTNNRNEPQ